MDKKTIPDNGIVDLPARAIGDAWTWTAIQEMIHTYKDKDKNEDKDKHIKVGEVYINAEFKVTPNVSIQILPSAGSSMLRLYVVNINAIDGADGGRTQIAVFAQTLDGCDAIGQHFLTMSVTGVPVKGPKI